MAYVDFKDSPRRTAFDKILRDKAFNITENQNMMDIKKVLLQWFINCSIKNKNMSDLQLAEELL